MSHDRHPPDFKDIAEGFATVLGQMVGCLQSLLNGAHGMAAQVQTIANTVERLANHMENVDQRLSAIESILQDERQEARASDSEGEVIDLVPSSAFGGGPIDSTPLPSSDGGSIDLTPLSLSDGGSMELF